MTFESSTVCSNRLEKSRDYSECTIQSYCNWRQNWSDWWQFGQTDSNEETKKSHSEHLQLPEESRQRIERWVGQWLNTHSPHRQITIPTLLGRFGDGNEGEETKRQGESSLSFQKWYCLFCNSLENSEMNSRVGPIPTPNSSQNLIYP